MCPAIGLVVLSISKVTVNVLDIIIVLKLLPFKLLCLPHRSIQGFPTRGARWPFRLLCCITVLSCSGSFCANCSALSVTNYRMLVHGLQFSPRGC